MLLGRGGAPFVEEVEDIFGGHGTRGLEFATLLAEEELAIGIKDGERRNSTVERDVVFLGDIEISVHLADVDMHDEEGFIEGRSDLRAVECFVENMAIEAPVATKDDKNALVGSGCGVECFGNFLVGVDAFRIDLFVFEGLAETGGGSVTHDAETPLLALAEPVLGGGHKLLFDAGALLSDEGELEN